MSKIFKRIATILAVAVALLCMGVFASACVENTPTEATEYTVTVCYSDGTTAVDGTKNALKVQICDASGKFCYGVMPTIDASGVAKFDIEKVDAAAAEAKVTEKTYVIHVWSADYEQLEIKEEVKVSSSNASVKVVLKDVAAPQA